MKSADNDDLFESVSDYTTETPRHKVKQSKEHSQYDPFKNLPHLHKIKTDYDLSSSQITPFNKVEFI